MYRCVIIGCGKRARMHASAYRLVPDGHLVACCDHHEERRESFATMFGVKPYADVEQMLAVEQPDLVHIVTPPSVRVDIMTLVSDSHVPAAIVEKPIAQGVEDWRALCRLSRETRTKFAVCHQFRYGQPLIQCRDALVSGQLGPILFLDFSAGMNMAGQGTHVLDWAMFLNNDSPVLQVFGNATGMSADDAVHPAPDVAAAHVVFANGTRGFWSTGRIAARVRENPSTHLHCRVAAYAEQGRVLYEEFGRLQIVSPGAAVSTSPKDDEIRELNHAAQAGLTNAVLGWIADDTQPAGTNLERALHQWNVVLGVYASAVYHRPVDIPFDPPEDLFDLLSRHAQVSDALNHLANSSVGSPQGPSLTGLSGYKGCSPSQGRSRIRLSDIQGGSS